MIISLEKKDKQQGIITKEDALIEQLEQFNTLEIKTNPARLLIIPKK